MKRNIALWKLSETLGLIIAFLCLNLMVYAGKQPNVLLILTDNQSFHELSLHGHKFVRTPNIDALAEEGLEFKNFHASNFCSPSRGTLLTGRYPLRYGVYNTTGGVSILHKNEKTLANYLKDAGYKTAIFGKWHLGMSYPYAPQYRGFDECFIIGGGGIGQLEDAFGNTHMDARFWHNDELVQTKGFSTDVLFEEAMNFINSNKDGPFFCYIPTPALHTPLPFPHPEVARRMKDRGVKGPFEKNEFEAYTLIENIDDNVGKILAQIDNLGLREQTIVIVTSDQGMKDRWGIKTTGEYPETNKFDVKNHVFFFLRYPPINKVTGTTGAISGLIDVFPTVLDLCGIEIPENIDGRSQRPILEGAEQWNDDRIIIFQCPRNQPRDPWVNVSVKTQHFRMQDSEELYDVGTGQEVSDQFPGEQKRLLAAYDSFWNSLPTEEEILSRHEIGPHATRLCAMDWYKGEKAPWSGNSVMKKDYIGTWAVEVMKPGKYAVDLRRFPREASGNTAIEATHVYLDIGGEKVSEAITPDVESVVLELDLRPGKYDMDAVFSDNNGKKWGSYFAYISLIK